MHPEKTKRVNASRTHTHPTRFLLCFQSTVPLLSAHLPALVPTPSLVLVPEGILPLVFVARLKSTSPEPLFSRQVSCATWLSRAHCEKVLSVASFFPVCFDLLFSHGCFSSFSGVPHAPAWSCFNTSNALRAALEDLLSMSSGHVPFGCMDRSSTSTWCFASRAPSPDHHFEADRVAPHTHNKHIEPYDQLFLT